MAKSQIPVTKAVKKDRSPMRVIADTEEIPIPGMGFVKVIDYKKAVAAEPKSDFSKIKAEMTVDVIKLMWRYLAAKRPITRSVYREDINGAVKKVHNAKNGVALKNLLKAGLVGRTKPEDELPRFVVRKAGLELAKIDINAPVEGLPAPTTPEAVAEKAGQAASIISQ